MKFSGALLKRRSVSVLVGRLLLMLISLLLVSVSSVWADEISVNNRGDYGNISVMELSGDFDANLPDGTVNTAPREALAKEFYRTHQDDYDFLIFFTNFDYQMPTADTAGYYLSIKNDVQGLGVELFDHSSQYGSDGHLQGTIDMRSLEVNGSSPLDPEYTHTLNTLEHEILHRWSAHTKFLDADGNISEALLSPDKSHWNYLLDSDGSLHYGNDWRDNGDGTFTSVAIRQNYSPLDLYLMGMIDKSAVPPMLLIDSPALSSVYLPKLGDTISGTARTVTIEQIIAAMGERLPSAAEAPKSFKAAFIFVTRPDSFNGKELASLEAIRNGFLTRFSILTDGQGLVQVTPTLQPALPVNPAIEQPDFVPRTLPPSLAEGVAWLRTQQQESGRWSDVEQTAVRDTTETLAALGLFGADPGLELGTAWLMSIEPDSTDYLARRLEALALAGSPVTAVVADLLARQNSDGGWGSTRSYQSNSTDTSLALRALVRAGQQQNPAALRAAVYLAEHQNEDGGWGGGEAFSMVQPSAHSLVALNPYKNYPQILASLDRSKNFLLAKQNSDGGFGNSPSTIYDSSAALLALGEVGASAVSTREAVTYLENRQFPDGSWYDSPFQTAAAVQALWRATLDPDLAVSVESISLIPDQISHLPTEQVVSVVVNNLGRTDVQQATVSLYEGAVDAEHLLLEQTAAFPGLGSTTLTFPLTLDVARTYSLIVVVDGPDQVAELDEANNRIGKTLTVEETHDFAFSAEGVRLSKTDLLQGEGTTITAQLFNYGTVAAYSVPVRFYLSDSSSTVVDIATPAVDIPAGKQTTVELFWHASIPGDNLQVVAEIDHNNLFAELDETNNRASTSMRVAGSQLPNLAFASEPLFSNAPALQDKATEISVTLLNSGSVAAQNVVLSYYQGAPEAGGILLGTYVVPEIAAGERMPVSFTWSEIPVIGEQLIVVRADVEGTLAEVDENDNQTLSRLMVLSRPDLVLAPADVAISPSAPREGEAVQGTVNLYNNGQQDAIDVAVTLDLDGTLIEMVVPLVAAKSWTQFETILGESLVSGVHNLRVDIDPADSLRELSEENNHAELSFGVQNADLWVSEQYFSPNGDGVKDTTELYYRFATEQVVSIEIRNDADEVVRYLEGSQSSPVLDGRMSWDGRNDRGVVVADGPYRINLVSVSGSVLGSIQVIVDTNRSSLFAALETDFVLDEVLACDLPSRAQWEWLPDEKRLLFAITNSTQSDYETGLYSKDVATGEIRRLVPDGWISSNPLVSYTGFKFFMSPDKSRLVLEFIKRDGKTLEFSTELWLLDNRGRGLQKFRGYSGSFGVRNLLWSPTGQHLLISASQTVELVETANLTGKILDVYSTYNFAWAPDGSRLLRAGTNLQVIELDGSVREVFNEWSVGYWLNSQQIVAVGMDSSEREKSIWRVDSSGVDAPLLLSDDYSHSLVIARDGKHIAFVEGFSTTGGVKKVSVFDESGHKTIVHETPYQTKDREYSYYNTSIGMGIISNLLWSQDSKRLAYVDRLAEPIAESTFVPKLFTYAVDGGEQTSMPLFGCSSLITTSCDSAGTCWSGCEDVDPQLEMGRIKSLLHWSADGRFIAVEAEDNNYLLDFVTAEKRVLPVYRPVYFSPNLDEILYEGSSCLTGDFGVWRFSSLFNMTVDLRPVRERTAIPLYGTAADINFASYRLEYVDVLQPDHWLPIQPPITKAVADENLTLWVPPQIGSYLLRLTVEDKAGNQSFSRKRVNWAQTSILSSFYRTTDIFSPNGDGVLDSMELAYRVKSPVQFTAEVRNDDGEVVRRYARSYSQPLDDAIVWDGRDDTGQVVPDGDYVLSLLDFSFGVEVDATPPKVKIEQVKGENKRGFDQVTLGGLATDINLDAMWFENKRINGSNDWSLYQVSECDGSAPRAICRETEFVGTDIGDMLRFQDYRLVAKDRAGNTSIVVASKIEPGFSLDAWGSPVSLSHYPNGKIPFLRQGDPPLHRVIGYTTLNEDWVAVGLQYWVGGAWHDADEEPQSDLQKLNWLFNAPQNGSFFFNWDATPVLDKIFKLRLKAVNAAGEVRLSNEYSTDELFGLENDCSDYGGVVSLFENLQEWHLQVVPEPTLTAILDTQDPPLTFDSISQLSNEKLNELFKDLPASVWEDYLVRHVLEEIPGNVYEFEMGLKRFDPFFSMIFPENAGDHYLLRMVGSGESGQPYISGPVAYPAEKKCIATKLHRLPVSSCSTEPAGSMDFYLDEILPSSVYIFDKIEFFVKSDDGELQIKTWNSPFPRMSVKAGPNKYWGVLSIDVTKLPPGQAQLVARLNYLDVGDGQMKSKEISYDFVVPDWSTPVPQVSLEVPRDGTPLNCRTWRLPDGSWRPMSVEAEITAASPLQNFDVCYFGSDAAGIGPAWYKLPNPVESQSLLDGLQSYKGHLSNLDSERLLDSGASALRLIARDQNGQFGFDEIGFSGPKGLLSGTGASLKQFSPNEDGVKDEVVIYYHLAEEAQVSLRVTGGALVDAALLTDQLQLAGDHSFVWMGGLPGLGIAADGDYRLNVSAVDFCGSIQENGVDVRVDTVAPLLEFTQPLEGSQIPVGKVVEVMATTDEKPLASYNLVSESIGSGAASSSTMISGGRGWPAGNRLGNWQTATIPGLWLLTLEAEDEAGNKGATTSQVDLVPRPILFSSMVLDPVYLSPNGDGRQDQLLVQYDLRERTQVTYEVLDQNANVIYTLALPEVAPGAKNWSWDGLSSAGAVVVDGAYSCRLSAALVTDPNLTQVEELTFVVDSTAPTLAFSTPPADAFLSVNPILLSGILDDINMLDYIVEVATDSGLVIVDSGLAARPVYELSLSEPLEEGVYHINAATNDLAGNRSELSRTFTLDRTPPLVKLLSPLDNAGFGIETPLVSVKGTVNDEHLADYRLRYGSGDDPQLWQTLQTSGNSPASDVGFDWSVGLPDGPSDGRYTLSLVATDRAGLEGEARRQILIDNHPPTARIDLPADGALLNDSFTITGTAVDGNFKEALLELSPDGCTSASRWSALQTMVAPLENSPLAEMSILPADGDYCLRLTVIDLVGNSTQALRNMTLDTTPPEAPVLGGNVVDSREVHLSWVTSGEPDIEGFHIYRDETQVSQQPALDKSYSDNDMLEGEYSYSVQAFDRAGNVSTRSNTFIATVDRTPPVTKLSHPADGARVGDLINIHGTAYSEDDFSEYRISYGLGEQPLEWTELRRSPIPINGSRLVQWDSWGLPDGLYSLHLEAEDLSGNLAVDVLQVEIDNTPPQAPTLNIPEVLQPDVSLTWESNPETDIAGYLLYRNGRLANASGVVIGPLTPYQLAGLDYQDLSLNDGSFVYTLVAVDLAGNQSLPSQERVVEIDTRAPRAFIIEPAVGERFDAPLVAVADSEDLDIASIQFQYRPVGSDLWQDLGAAFEAIPYAVTLDPDLLSLNFGELELRALATDRGGQIDPAPAAIQIEYRDMTPPAAPLGLTVSFDCDEVALNWSINTEADLAGYNVYRKFDNDYLALQNSQPLQAPLWIQVFGTGDYTFVVKAVDQSGNESLSSETVSIQMKTPVLGSTEDLTIEPHLNLSGTEAYPNARAQLLSNGTTVAESLSDNNGVFAFTGVSLDRGENEFSVVAIDNEGNRSCSSDSLMITKTILLPPPEGLQDQVAGLDVQLSWQPVVDPEMGQYYVYRDGSRLELPTQLIASDQMTAYSDSILTSLYPAVMAIDGNYGSSWLSAYQYGTNKWLEVVFDQPRWVNGFYVIWPNTFWQGVDFEFQVWDGSDWQAFFQKTGNTSLGNSYSGSAYLTNKVRLLITGFNNSSYYAGVTEFQIYEKPAIDLPSYLDSVSQDGQYNYQVSTVNSYGMEGPLSAALPVAVGDVEPPAPPVNLTVTAPPQGRTLHLTWEAGSTDTDHFNVYRAASSGGPYEIVGTTDWDRLLLVDTGLTNGIHYYYVVTASDQFDNESVYSLESSGMPLDLLPPETPSLFYPTVPGLDKIVYQEETFIRGLTEPDATVKLFAEGLQIGETVALSVPEINSVQYDFSGMDALLSPHGDYLLYIDDDRYDDGLVLRDLKAKTEVLIAERVEYYVWSGDGKRITYIYDDVIFNDFVAFYIVETGEQTTITSDFEVDIDYLSSSADGGIVAFVSDIDGDDDVWVKDLHAGTLTQLSTGLWAETTAVAPDGTKVAYYDDDDGILYVTDLVGGATVEVDLDPYWRHFEWSSDSRYLAYLSYSNGNKDIYVYDSVSLKSDQITDISTYKYDLHWAPDGKSIIYEQSSDDSIRLHFLSGEEYTLASDLADLTTLQWLSTGEIVVIDDNSNRVDYLLPPGTFTFNSVSLHPGENQFYATATDQLGRLSPTSGSISVIYDSSRLPDIAVAENEVFLLPSVPAPGEQVVANVLVRNNTGTAAQNVKVDLYLWDSQANLEFLESRTITQLDGEGTATLSFSFMAPDLSGRSSLLVLADPENEINELIESNNFADRAFQVTAVGGVQMSITLNRDAIASQQDLGINLELLNNGPAVDGRLEMKILDQSGHLVELLSQAGARLAYGLEQFDYVWNAGALFAGEYQVWSGLHDNQGQLLVEQFQPFSILPDRSADLSLTTNSSSYGANEPVLLEIDLQNSGTNDILSNLQLKTVIRDISGQELFSDHQPVSQLLPGMSGRFSAVWNTAQHTPGDFNVVTELWLENEVLQSDTGSFKIYPVSKLTGNLRVEPQAVVYGLDFMLPFAVANRGNQAAAGQLRVELFDPERLGVVATAEQDMTIAVDGKLAGEFTLSSAGLKLQSYRARLFHVTGVQVQLISEVPFQVIDGMAPELAVKSPLVDEIYRQLVHVEVVVRDDISGVASVSFRLDTGDWQLLPFADLAAGRFATIWHPALKDNGAHKIEFVVQDQAGNTRQSSPIDFELQMDVTPPVTQLERGLPYYRSSENVEYLAATSSLQLLATDDISGVALTEYRLDSGEWKPYGTSISMAGLVDGEHIISFRSTDALGNVETEKFYNFVIDNAPPVITVVTPMAGEFYNSDVLTQVEISDFLPTHRETALFRNGELVGIHSQISDEGEYRFDMTAVDSLGNQSSETVGFTIDKTAPVIVASGFTDAANYNTDVTPSVVVSDPYLAMSTFQINGSDFVSGTVIGAEGTYDLFATASDFAGNTVAESWSFVVDKTAPESRLEFTDSYYQASGALFVSPRTKFSLLSADPGLVPSGVDHIEYAFTQQAIWNSYVDSFDLLGLSEGNQTINYRASDRAGNLEEYSTLKVVLDQSSPVTDISYHNVTFTDIDGNLVANGTTGFELSAVDALSGVDRTTYRIDGDVWVDFAPFDLAGLADGVHQIDYLSIDRVANEEPTRTLMVTTDNTAPATNISVEGIQYTSAGNLYVTAATSIALNATDNLSGVASTEYRIDGGIWSAYAPFALTELIDGQHVIGFRSTDKVANVEMEKELTVVVDNTAPLTNITQGEPQFSTGGALYATAATNFTLAATDNLSGVKRVEYRIDNGDWATYAAFTLAGLTDGQRSIAFRSTDNLGNTEEEQSVSVLVDNSPPVTEIAAGAQKYVGVDGLIYVTSATDFILTASDNLAGVAATEYRLDTGVWTPYVAFTLNGLVDGAHSIAYRSTDSLGNQEQARTLSVVVDNTAPVTEFMTGTPQFTAADATLFISSATEFILSAADNYSGVAATEYRIDEGAWSVYSAFMLNGLVEGAHSIAYRSIDSLGNIEEVRTLAVVLDDTAAVTEIVTGTPQFTNSDATLFVSGATGFTLTSNDNYSGVAATEYLVDGGAWSDYAPFSLNSSVEGAVVIGFRSTDNLGHLETEQSLNIVVDNSPPVTSIAFNNQSYMGSDQLLVTGKTEISLTAVDYLAGVADIFFRFDDQPGWQPYSGVFLLDALAFGSHAIHFRSVDHVMNMESESSVEFVQIGVESNTSVINVPRVLIWLGDEDKGHEEDNDHGDDGKDDPERDNEDREHGQKIDSSRQDALDLLVEAFAGQDVYYQVVGSEADYRRAIRSGVFNLTLILNEKLPFGGDFVPEFVEGVRRGMGLLFAPGKYDGDSPLEGLLGVKFKGEESNKQNLLGLQFYTSPVSEEGEGGLVGPVLKTELAGGTLAALIPGEKSSAAINSMTLSLPLEIHDRDVVKVSLSRRHGNCLDIVDEEWLAVDEQEQHQINRSSGNIYGDLSLKGHDDGLDLRIASNYGAFTGVYELDVSVVTHDDGKIISIISGLALDWVTKWSVGAPVGICRVTEINDKSQKKSQDLPGVVLHQFGEGNTTFLAFDLVASAKTADRSTFLTLVQKALNHLLPEQSVPEAASTELLETTIKLSGSAMDLAAIEHLWPGLTYKPFFDLRQDLLEYHLFSHDGDEARYRYFVQNDDRSGIFGKEAEIQFFQDGIAIIYESYPYSFVVAKDSDRLIQDSIDWLDEMILLETTESGEGVEHEDGICDDKQHDHLNDCHSRKDGCNDDANENDTRFMELKEQLIKINSMYKNEIKPLEKVISKVLHALSTFDRLSVDCSVPRAWMSDYLRIMEAKYSESGGSEKNREDDDE